MVYWVGKGPDSPRMPVLDVINAYIYVQKFHFTCKRIAVKTPKCRSGNNEEIKGGVSVLVDQSSLGFSVIDGAGKAWRRWLQPLIESFSISRQLTDLMTQRMTRVR